MVDRRRTERPLSVGAGARGAARSGGGGGDSRAGRGAGLRSLGAPPHAAALNAQASAAKRGGLSDRLAYWRLHRVTGLDIIVLLAIGGAAVLGFMRGFVTEMLALLVWVVIVLAVKLLHSPLAEMLAGPVGTV